MAGTRVVAGWYQQRGEEWYHASGGVEGWGEWYQRRGKMVPRMGKSWYQGRGRKRVPRLREDGTRVGWQWYRGLRVIPEVGGEVYTKGWEDGSVVSESRWIGTRVGGGRTMVEGR